MNMIQMVGVMTLCYFITLIIICLYHNHINTKIGNIIFIIVDVIFFFGWNYAAYQKGWLKDGFMTLENISPFVMTLIPLTVFMNEKVKSYCNSAIAFLWLGLFIALGVSPEFSYIFNFDHDATFIYATEASCHLIASLYGVYLIISGQVVCDFKHWLKSVICIFSVIGFGIILNYAFHRQNFGMDPYGNYKIYMLDIFGSFGATLAAYLFGVLIVLTVGMQCGYLLNKSVSKIHIEALEKAFQNESAKDTAETDEENTVTVKEEKLDEAKKECEESYATDSD